MRFLLLVVLTLIIPSYINRVSTDNIIQSYEHFDSLRFSEPEEEIIFRPVLLPYSQSLRSAWGWNKGVSPRHNDVEKPFRMVSWGWSPKLARSENELDDDDYYDDDDDDDDHDEDGWGWEPKYGKCDRGRKKGPKKKELKKGWYVPEPPKIHNCGPGAKGPDDERGWKRAVRKKNRQKDRDYRKAMSWKKGAANTGWVPFDPGWPGYKGWKPRWYNWYETNLDIWL